MSHIYGMLWTLTLAISFYWHGIFKKKIPLVAIYIEDKFDLTYQGLSVYIDVYWVPKHKNWSLYDTVASVVPEKKTAYNDARNLNIDIDQHYTYFRI